MRMATKARGGERLSALKDPIKQGRYKGNATSFLFRAVSPSALSILDNSTCLDINGSP